MLDNIKSIINDTWGISERTKSILIKHSPFIFDTLTSEDFENKIDVFLSSIAYYESNILYKENQKKELQSINTKRNKHIKKLNEVINFLEEMGNSGLWHNQHIKKLQIVKKEIAMKITYLPSTKVELRTLLRPIISGKNTAVDDFIGEL